MADFTIDFTEGQKEGHNFTQESVFIEVLKIYYAAEALRCLPWSLERGTIQVFNKQTYYHYKIACRLFETDLRCISFQFVYFLIL